MKIYCSTFPKAFFAVCLNVISLQPVNAQEKSSHFIKHENISSGKCLDIQLEKPATSLSIQYHENDLETGFYIYADGEKYFVQHDADAEIRDGKVFSGLVVFPKAVSHIKVCSENYSGEISIHFLQVTYIKFDKNAFRQARYKTGCEKPVTVDQEIWRAGLNQPTIKPASHKVTHIIVHHTATSNTDSNYVNVVRNIYQFHTQVNGWDDIGYNFLVAPDGTIFQGRDGQDVSEDDDAKGAHFCNKNTNTMGISMIGDYQTVRPTDTALIALEKLIAWKMNKENLAANDAALHNGVQLQRISGHRDGCATECPGDSVYVRLPEVRNAVEKLMEDCTPPTVSIKQKHFSDNVYMDFDETNNQLVIRIEKPGNNTYRIVDLQGKIWANGNINYSLEIISAGKLPKGLYMFQLYNHSGKNTLKFVKF